ncbi:MAG: hypothetical protein JO068_05610 [Hyphomicrobiales bacterium]|nr:hypothetical protein [Hyphomicrobiales bacterium]
MPKGLDARFFLALLMSSLALANVADAAPAKARAPAPAAAPAAPEPGWALAKRSDGVALSYGLAGAEPVIAFACGPRVGDVAIRVFIEPRKTKIDESQSFSLTIGGVRSSFAGTVAQDPASGGTMLAVTVASRNPMFTALQGPGGMRIEGKGFAKIVPLKSMGEKLRQLLASCKKG